MQDSSPSSTLVEALSIVLQSNPLPCDSWLFRTLPLVAKPFKQVVDSLDCMDLQVSLTSDLQAKALASWLARQGRVEQVAKLTLQMDRLPYKDCRSLMLSDCSGLILLGLLLSTSISSSSRLSKGALTAKALVAAANSAKSSASMNASKRRHLQELTFTNASLLSNPKVLQAFLPLLHHVQHLTLAWQPVTGDLVTNFEDAWQQVEQQKVVMQLLLSQLTQLQSLALYWVRTHLPTQCYLPYTLAGLTNLTRLTLSGLTLTAASFMPVEQAEQRMEQQHGPGWRVPGCVQGGAGYGEAFPWGEWRSSAAGYGCGNSSSSSSRSSSSGGVDGLAVLAKLRHLELRSTAGWEEVAFHHLAQLLPNVEFLHVAYTPTRQVHLRIQDFAGLKKLRELLIVHQRPCDLWNWGRNRGVIEWEAWDRFRKAVPSLEVVCAIDLTATLKSVDVLLDQQHGDPWVNSIDIDSCHLLDHDDNSSSMRLAGAVDIIADSATTALMTCGHEHLAPRGFWLKRSSYQLALNGCPVVVWQKDMAAAPPVLPVRACLEAVRERAYYDDSCPFWHTPWRDDVVYLDVDSFELMWHYYRNEWEADWDYWESGDPLPLEATSEGDACYDVSTCCSRRRLLMKPERQKGEAGRHQEAHHQRRRKLKDKGNVKAKNAFRKQVNVKEVQTWRYCS
jgi:hypothetical protein